ncbi:MAG: 3-deoxy-D-manno-octulosonic acid transferase [Sulfurospirillum sp.]|nr:MAG: 3-deoxy-D-manno-octulosonic acid transferase [Sulfurospirillum sp.]
MFTFLYLCIGTVLYVAAVPVLILLSFFPKYRKSIPARFFLINNPPFRQEGIWFHACSLGEVKSLAPLIKAVDAKSNISVITNTGFEAAATLPAERRFLPFEIFLPFWVTPQKALVVLEAELWYMLFWAAKRKGIKTYLLNARISDRSYANYRRFGWFYRKLFANVDRVFAQSEKDKRRLEELGAREVTVTGNIKAYQQIVQSEHYRKPFHEVVTLASTHEKEEEMLLQNLSFDGRTVIVVPRHPERFDAVDTMLKQFCDKKGLGYHRFSERADFDDDVILADLMGALVNIYAISDIVLLGGSFVEGIGGHNPLEPAHFGVKLISGKYIHNQEALFPLVKHLQLCDADEIERCIAEAEPSAIEGAADMEPVLRELRSVV